MASFDPIRRQLERQVRRTMETSRDEMVRAVEDAAPRTTGQLAESITATPIRSNPDRSSFTVETGDLIQAETTEKGARPHIILPRRARALAFTPRGSSRVVVVKRVNHPGNPARPWFAPTVGKWGTLVRSVWNRFN